MKISSYYHVFIGFIVFFGLHFSTISDAFANPRYASIILEESSGKILFSRNADKQLRPASLTKIMTLYLMFEALQQKKSDNGHADEGLQDSGKPVAIKTLSEARTHNYR